jgi:protein phosphatase/serine/threonine-protein phosphatase Stp1
VGIDPDAAPHRGRSAASRWPRVHGPAKPERLSRMIDGERRQMGTPGFHSFASSHQGKRLLNEDSYVDRPEVGIWAVADGMGGGQAGDLASAAIRDGLMAIPTGLSGDQVLAEVRQSLQRAHLELRETAAARQPPAVIASTVVVLITAGTYFACLWAGDSRAYLLRNGELLRLTNDHSLVQLLVEAGSITEEVAGHHPQANVITRAVGIGPTELELDKKTGELLVGDRFLLCSDGLSKTLDHAELATLLAAPEGTRPPELLVQAALAHEVDDNVTAVTVEVTEQR